MLNTQLTFNLFNAIESGNISKIHRFISKHTRSFNQLLKQRIKKSLTLYYIERAQLENKSTPTLGEIGIQLAIKNNHFEVVKLLHEAGGPIHHGQLQVLLSLLNITPPEKTAKLFSYLIENGIDINNIILDAIQRDDVKLIQYIGKIKWSYINQFTDGKSNNILIDYAIKYNAVHILKLLYQNHDKDNMMGRELRKNKVLCENTLKIPMKPLELTDLISGSQVTPKGLTLLLEYYYKKKHYSNHNHKLYFAMGIETLFHALDLFIKSIEPDLTLLYCDTEDGDSMGPHRNVFRFEKYNNKIYIILMDSYYTENNNTANYFDTLINIMRNKIPEKIPQIVLCKNLTNQQTDQVSCSHFSLKNISKLLTTPCMAKEIIEKNLILEKSTHQCFDVIYYQIPARFMNTAQSYDRIQKYLKENTSENLNHVRINKEKQIEDLSKYTFHKRNKYGVKTPKTIQNRNYKPDNGEPKFVKKNLTIEYFTNKHKTIIIPAIFQEAGGNDCNDEYKRQTKLCNTIKQRTANNLTLSKSQRLITK